MLIIIESNYNWRRGDPYSPSYKFRNSDSVRFCNLSRPDPGWCLRPSQDLLRHNKEYNFLKCMEKEGLKYNLALKSHPNVTVHINYRFLLCNHNGNFYSIIRFNIRLSTFAKFVEFLKSSTVKAELNIFSDFPV